ncbi:MAG: hypothetical protein J1E02_05605 [Coprobacter sp.]|nr:hypothetical protein [Coprobacter sp.]
MKNDLRKVRFSLCQKQYRPDEDLQKKNEELSRIRLGYFHRWIDDVDNSKEIPCIKAYALVEDADTGKIHPVDYWLLTFIDDFKEKCIED